MTDPWRSRHFGLGYSAGKREWKRRNPICIIEGCNNPHEAKGLCRAHYLRLRRHGNPSKGMPFRGANLEWLQSIRNTRSPDCIIMAGSTEGRYLRVTFEGRRWGAHHLICVWTHGEPPTPQHEAAHSCGRPSCCNPGHLRWASPAENSADRLLHGTDARGEKSATAKLTAEQVRAIRRLKGRVSQADLAALTGCYFNHVGKIQRGEIWIGDEYAA